jgi:flagellar motor protein MotB
MARHKRAHAEGAHENEERWLLTYSDLITLLFVLFVVMYAISNTDTRKFIQLAQSMSQAFNTDVFSGNQALTIADGQQVTVVNETNASARSSSWAFRSGSPRPAASSSCRCRRATPARRRSRIREPARPDRSWPSIRAS